MPATVSELTYAPSATTPDYRKLYFALFGIGFALRIVCMVWWKSYNFGTLAPYNEVGRLIERLATGRGFTAPYGDETGYTAAFPPVYPFLGAIPFKLFGSYTPLARITILAMNCVFGAFNAVLIHKLGLRTLGQRAALLAAWAWALFPVFFRWDISWIWEFSLSAMLLTWVFVLTMDLAENGTRKRWMGFGAAWGFTCLANPALASLLPFSGLYAAFRNRRAGRRWFVPAVISAVMFFAMLSPWLVRNYAIFHKVFFVRDNFWLEFQLGNFHGSTALGFGPLHPTGSERLLRRFHDLGELGYMEDRKQMAVAFVRNHPAEFRDLTLRRLQWFWDGTSVLYQANEWWRPWEVWWLSVVSLLGLLFVLTRRPPGWILYLAAVLVYPVPYYLTYANAKYRHAIEPELALLGAYLMVVIYGEIRKSSKPSAISASIADEPR
jgi:4-amino-4-deoxy-L-arabinose transferase-like glycosyltransferase